MSVPHSDVNKKLPQKKEMFQKPVAQQRKYLCQGAAALAVFGRRSFSSVGGSRAPKLIRLTNR